MFRTTQPIWLVMLVVAGVVLFGSLPAVAMEDYGAKISKIKLTDTDKPGYIETEIDGITPINPHYSIDGSPDTAKPMNPAAAVWICKGDPGLDPESNPDCRQVITSTFGAAWNTWVCWGGRWFYIAP